MYEVTLHILNCVEGRDDEISHVAHALQYRAPWLRDIDIDLKVLMGHGDWNLPSHQCGSAHCLLIGKYLPTEVITAYEESENRASGDSPSPFDIFFVKPPDGEISATVKEFGRRLRRAKHPLVHYPRNERDLERIIAERIYATAISSVLNTNGGESVSRSRRLARLLQRRAILLETMLRPKDALACYGESSKTCESLHKRCPTDYLSKVIADFCSYRQKVLLSKLKGGSGFYLPMPVYHVTSQDDPTVLVGIDVRVIRGFERGQETLSACWLDTVREREMDVSSLRYSGGRFQFERGEIDGEANYVFTPMTLQLYRDEVRENLAGQCDFHVEEEMIEGFLMMEYRD